MIRYKTGIMLALKDKGYSSTALRRDRVFGEKVMQDFRSCAEVPYKSINKLCELLGCQPGDILEYVPDEVDAGGQKESAESVGA